MCDHIRTVAGSRLDADALRRGRIVSLAVPPTAVRQSRERYRARQQLVRARVRVVQENSGVTTAAQRV